MDFYEIGINLALEKLATSRWREAIRSGEVSPEAASAIRERMGFDPKAHARGMMEGAKRRAVSHGYKFFEHTPRAYLGEAKRLAGMARQGFGEKGLQGVGQAVKQWAPGAGERAIGLLGGLMGGGGGANPTLKRVDLVPGMKGTRGGAMPIVGVHEAGEVGEIIARRIPSREWYRQIPETKAQRLARTVGGTRDILAEGMHAIKGPYAADYIRRKSVHDLRQLLQEGLPTVQPGMNVPMPGVHTSQHASAVPPISDIREGRLLGGKGQRRMEALRRSTGELGTMLEAAPARTTAGPYLPKHRVRQIADEMRRINLERGAQIAKGEAGPVASRVARGIARLRKLLGR